MAGRGIEVRGGVEVIRELEAAGLEVEAGIALATASQGRELQRLVKFKASTGVHGPREPHIPGTGPGPNVVTGTYVGSIELDERHVDGIVTAEVYTDEARAERLEYGFVGSDSLGRRFNQRPYPHWEPAFVEVEAAFFAQVDAIVRKAGGR